MLATGSRVRWPQAKDRQQLPQLWRTSGGCANLWTPWFQNCDITHFCCLRTTSLWQLEQPQERNTAPWPSSHLLSQRTYLPHRHLLTMTSTWVPLSPRVLSTHSSHQAPQRRPSVTGDPPSGEVMMTNCFASLLLSFQVAETIPYPSVRI